MTKTEHFNRYHKSGSRLLMPKNDVEGNRRRSEKQAAISRKRVVCVETGEVYPSLTELSKILGTNTSLSTYIRKEIPYKGLNYKYI